MAHSLLYIFLFSFSNCPRLGLVAIDGMSEALTRQISSSQSNPIYTLPKESNVSVIGIVAIFRMPDVSISAKAKH